MWCADFVVTAIDHHMTAERMRADFARVCALLNDTVTLLCKNGLMYKTELKIQGVIGVTVDSDVFVVHINETFADARQQVVRNCTSNSATTGSYQGTSSELALVTYRGDSKPYVSPARAQLKAKLAQQFSTPNLKHEAQFEMDCYADGNDDNMRTAPDVKSERDVSEQEVYDVDFEDSDTEEEGDGVRDGGGYRTVANNGGQTRFADYKMEREDNKEWGIRVSGDQMSWQRSSSINGQSTSNTHDVNDYLSSDGRRQNSIMQQHFASRLIRSRGRGHGVVRAKFMQQGRNAFNPDADERDSLKAARSTKAPGVGGSLFTRARGSAGGAVHNAATDGFSYGKLTVTNYVCNICNAQYKHQCNLLTHQVRVHGREKKRGIGRRPKVNNDIATDLNASSSLGGGAFEGGGRVEGGEGFAGGTRDVGEEGWDTVVDPDLYPRDCTD